MPKLTTRKVITSGIHFTLLALLSSSMWTFPALAADIGKQAPAFELTGTDKVVKLADYKGKVVYLDFWASWCGPCRKSFPWMNAMQSKYASRGFQVVGVNLDENSEDGTQFLKDMPAQFIVAFDPKAKTPGPFGVKGMPTSLLIDRDGKVIFEHSGFNDADRADLEKKIQSALEGGK